MLDSFYLFYDNRIGTISVDGKNLKTNIGSSASKGIESFIELIETQAKMIEDDEDSNFF